MPIEKLRPSFTFDEDRINELKKIAPEAFADGKINWETLKEALGNFLEDEEEAQEHFGLFWPGKRMARRIAAIPSKGTLVPVYGEGLKADGTPDSDGHNDSRNIFIEGENLEVLKILQKAYAGRIKMIYIDPPYNTGNDFVYDDNFTEPLQEYLRRTGQVDEEGQPLTTNKKADGRFHSKWLSMMYPRLRLARNLLRDDGVIFVSIDDNEVHNLRAIMNEVFGEENFIAQLVWSGGRKNDSKYISVSHEYVLCYVKSIDFLKEQNIIWRIRKEGLKEIYDVFAELTEEYGNDFTKIEEELKKWYSKLPKSHPSKAHKHYNHIDSRGIYFPDNISWPGGGGPKYEILHPITKKPVKVPSRGWMWPDKSKMEEAIADNRVHFGIDESYVPCIKSYLKDREYQVAYSVFYQDGRASTKRLRKLLGGDFFDHPKDEQILLKLFEMVTCSGDIILDFFAGSATTAQASWELNLKDSGNRKFILIQLPEKVEEKSIAYKSGIRKISELATLRIKKVSENIKQNNEIKNIDIGCKSIKLYNSNYKNWQDFQNIEIMKLEELFDKFESPLIDDWSESSLLFESILIEGFPLDSTIEKLDNYQANKIKKVSSEFCDHALLICFDEKIHESTIQQLDLNGKDIFICLDSAITDQDKLRLSDKGLIKTI